jgi:hypothetical protein
MCAEASIGRSWRRTGVLPHLVVVGLLFSGGVASPAASAKPTLCGHVRTAGPWTTVDMPQFPLQTPTRAKLRAPELVPFAVSGGAPGRFFASDGVNLMRSVNGGCSWSLVFSLENVDTSTFTAAGVASVAMLDPTYVIASVAAPPSGAFRRAANDDVYMSLISNSYDGYSSHDNVNPTYNLNGVPRPVVMGSSTDGGLRWQLTALSAPLKAELPAATLLTSAHEAPLVVTSAGDPRVAYVLLVGRNGHYEDSAYIPATRLFATRDAGRTWGLTPSLGLPTNPPPDGLIVSATDPLALWLFGNDIEASRDGGRSWRPLNMPNIYAGQGYVAGLAVDARPGKASRILAVVRTSNASFVTAAYSTDAGRTWTDIGVPLGFGSNPDFVYAMDLEEGSEWPVRRLWVDPGSGDVVAIVPKQPRGTGGLQTFRYSKRTRGWTSGGTARISSSHATTDIFYSGQLIESQGRTLLINTAEPRPSSPDRLVTPRTAGYFVLFRLRGGS